MKVPDHTHTRTHTRARPHTQTSTHKHTHAHLRICFVHFHHSQCNTHLIRVETLKMRSNEFLLSLSVIWNLAAICIERFLDAAIVRDVFTYIIAIEMKLCVCFFHTNIISLEEGRGGERRRGDACVYVFVCLWVRVGVCVFVCECVCVYLHVCVCVCVRLLVLRCCSTYQSIPSVSLPLINSPGSTS